MNMDLSDVWNDGTNFQRGLRAKEKHKRPNDPCSKECHQ